MIKVFSEFSHIHTFHKLSVFKLANILQYLYDLHEKRSPNNIVITSLTHRLNGHVVNVHALCTGVRCSNPGPVKFGTVLQTVRLALSCIYPSNCVALLLMLRKIRYTLRHSIVK